MATNRIKAGLFSDGGRRIRTVAAGYAADPSPGVAATIFDSDWGELLPTDSSHYGTTTISASSAWQTVSFSSFGYVPFAFCAFTTSQTGFAYTPGNWYFPVTTTNAGATTPGLFVEVFADHLAFRYNPTGAGTVYPTTIEIAWCVVRTNIAASVSSASRAGTNWMRWSTNGLWVTKPGKDVSSTNVDDFLINATAGSVLTQPLLSGTISTLTYTGGGLMTGGYPYSATITHGLGYIPMCWVLYAGAIAGPSLPQVILTTSTLTINGVQNFSGTPPSTASFAPIFYSIMRQQWV